MLYDRLISKQLIPQVYRLHYIRLLRVGSSTSLIDRHQLALPAFRSIGADFASELLPGAISLLHKPKPTLCSHLFSFTATRIIR